MSTTKTLVVTNFNEDNASQPIAGTLRDVVRRGHVLAREGHNIRIVFDTNQPSQTIVLAASIHFRWGTWSINEGVDSKPVTISGDNKVGTAFTINARKDRPHANITFDQVNVKEFREFHMGWGVVKQINGHLAWKNSTFSDNASAYGIINVKYKGEGISTKIDGLKFERNSLVKGEALKPSDWLRYGQNVPDYSDHSGLVVTKGKDADFEAINTNLHPGERVIESTSAIKKDGSFSIHHRFNLDPDSGYAIYQSIEKGEQKIVTPSSTNDDQLLGAIRKHAAYTYHTQSEQTIKDSRTSFFGSSTSKMMGKTAAQQALSIAAGTETGKAIAEQGKAFAEPIIKKATQMWSTTKGKAILGSAGILGAAAAIGIGALFHHSEETARIEKELAKKREIDAAHDDFKASLPKRLEFNSINTLQERSVSIYSNYNFTHQNSIHLLPAGIDTKIQYIAQTDGRDVVSFSHVPESLKTNTTATNSTKEFARWVLSSELSSKMRHEVVKDPSGYISTLKKVNSKGEIFLSSTGRWQAQKANHAGYHAGPADDRIKVQRTSSFQITTNTETHSGNDIVIGDRGSNTILLGAGNDTAAPGVGDDHIDGGTGIDTVSYLGLNQPIRLTSGHVSRSGETYMQVSNQQALPAERSINSRLLNVETIDAEGGSHLDLSGAPQAMRSANSNEAAPYQLRTGIGSTVIGSDFHDGFTIDAARASRYNTDATRFGHTTTINGGEGFDTLLIRNLGDHQQAGREFRYDAVTGRINSSEASGQGQHTWFQVHNVESIGIQGASLRENGEIVFDQKTNGITTFDPPTSPVDELALDSNDETDELTGSSSADFSEGASTSPVPMRRLRMAEADMNLPLVAEVSETPEADAMQVMPASVSSMDHSAWQQQTKEQPIWAQKEFFVDPLA